MHRLKLAARMHQNKPRVSSPATFAISASNRNPEMSLMISAPESIAARATDDFVVSIEIGIRMISI